MVDLALVAGVDALLACRSFDLVTALLDRLESLPDATIEPALRRVASLKQRFAQPRSDAGEGETPGPPYPEHLALAARLSRTA